MKFCLSIFAKTGDFLRELEKVNKSDETLPFALLPHVLEEGEQTQVCDRV